MRCGTRAACTCTACTAAAATVAGRVAGEKGEKQATTINRPVRVIQGKPGVVYVAESQCSLGLSRYLSLSLGRRAGRRGKA